MYIFEGNLNILSKSALNVTNLIVFLKIVFLDLTYI